MANPFLYVACTKTSWHSPVPVLMLEAWGFDVDDLPYHPTWEEAMTHQFNAGRVAGPIRWKNDSEEDSDQCVFKMMWLPDVENFLKPLIDFIVEHPTNAKIMGHDEALAWLENQGWNE